MIRPIMYSRKIKVVITDLDLLLSGLCSEGMTKIYRHE